jgi:hypothetical protein
MTDYSRVLYVRHPSGPSYPHAPEPGGYYAQAPVEGCPCVICGHTRWQRIYCKSCGNLGSTNSPCYGCGRGCYWDEWGTQTGDVALGA